MDLALQPPRPSHMLCPTRSVMPLHLEEEAGEAVSLRLAFPPPWLRAVSSTPSLGTREVCARAWPGRWGGGENGCCPLRLHAACLRPQGCGRGSPGLCLSLGGCHSSGLNPKVRAHLHFTRSGVWKALGAGSVSNPGVHESFHQNLMKKITST